MQKIYTKYAKKKCLNMQVICYCMLKICYHFPSLIAVHYARSSSIVTLLVLRSFICIWAHLCLVAGRAEASEVEDVRARCAREVDVCMAHRCYRMRNGMRASPSPGVEPDPHEAAPPGVAM